MFSIFAYLVFSYDPHPQQQSFLSHSGLDFQQTRLINQSGVFNYSIESTFFFDLTNRAAYLNGDYDLYCQRSMFMKCSISSSGGALYIILKIFFLLNSFGVDCSAISNSQWIHASYSRDPEQYYLNKNSCLRCSQGYSPGATISLIGSSTVTETKVFNLNSTNHELKDYALFLHLFWK